MALLADAAVGAVFGELLGAVLKIKTKAVMFKQTLVNLQSILISIAPVIKQIEQHNNELRRPKGELKSLKTKMDDGRKLVLKCSNIHWLNFVRRANYQEKLEEFENWLVKIYVMEMQGQAVRDQKETLCKVNRIISVLNKYIVDVSPDGNLPVSVSSDSNPEPGEVTKSVLAYMLTARNLFIVWGETPSYWRWISVPEARFSEVAELVSVCWLEIKGWIKTSTLSPNTLYGTYFVFKQRSDGDGAFGFEDQAVEVSIKVAGEGDGQRRTVYLEAAKPHQTTVSRILNHVRSCFLDSSDAAKPSRLGADSAEYPKERNDGWMEVELGDFFSGGDGEDKEVEMGVCEVESGMWKGGILVQGIEIRPKLKNI